MSRLLKARIAAVVIVVCGGVVSGITHALLHRDPSFISMFFGVISGNIAGIVLTEAKR